LTQSGQGTDQAVFLILLNDDTFSSASCSLRNDVVVIEEVAMRKRVLAITASVVVLAFGALGPIAQAQGPAAPDPASQNKDGAGMIGRGGMMGEGMMGEEMMGMGHGMMGHGMRGHGMIGQGRPGGTLR
jgi:hypothetical protein